MNKRIKIFIICSGLGNINRGYESFTRECFEALSKFEDLQIMLLKGGGESKLNEYRLINLRRNSKFTIALSKLIRKNPYHIEQFSFCISMILKLLLHRPDIIYFSDFKLGTYLWHLRRYIKLNYKLLFTNGAPNVPPFSRVDYVQHLTPTHFNMALNYGEAKDKHSLQPLGANINKSYKHLSLNDRKLLKKNLYLPENKKIILSVGTINKSHKRMDYVIKEFAKLKNPNLFLLLLGQENHESSEIKKLACNTLNPTSYKIETVSNFEMADYYKTSDIFVLASLTEGFGRVLVEAMNFGLPCVVHDYEITKFVLQDYGYYSDLTREGSLKDILILLLQEKNDFKMRKERHDYVYENFSWNKLTPRYLKMLRDCYDQKS